MDDNKDDKVFTEEQLSKLGGRVVQGGKFYDALRQNAREIKEGQAAQLAEDLEFSLRNKILELKNALRTSYRGKEAMIAQFMPAQTTSLKLAEGFKPAEFANDYIRFNLEIREGSIRLNAALDAYEELIGKKFE